MVSEMGTICLKFLECLIGEIYPNPIPFGRKKSPLKNKNKIMLKIASVSCVKTEGRLLSWGMDSFQCKYSRQITPI